MTSSVRTKFKQAATAVLSGIYAVHAFSQRDYVNRTIAASVASYKALSLFSEAAAYAGKWFGRKFPENFFVVAYDSSVGKIQDESDSLARLTAQEQGRPPRYDANVPA